MNRNEAPPPVTFVVRAMRDNAGRVRGTVTQVRTGEAAAFAGIQEGARALADMLTRDFEGEGDASAE